MKLFGDITANIYSNLRSKMKNKHFRKLLLLTGFWTLVATGVAGQSCPTGVTISFRLSVFENYISIAPCQTFDQGGSTINIYSTTGNVTGVTRVWQYSTVSSSGPWITAPDNGATFYVGSFSSTPGNYFFQLQLTKSGCSTITSNYIEMQVTGSLPPGPTSPPVSQCNPGSVTLTASGCTSYQWWNVPYGGTTVGTNASYTTPSLPSGITTFYVSCISGTCNTPRTAVPVTIGAPASLGTITGATTVCFSQNGVAYSVPNYTGMNYTWTYSGSGATINGQGSSSITIDFSGTATPGTLSVSGTASCGTSTATPLAINVGNLAPPTIGTITQPDCTTPTGTVQLTGLPTASGQWTVTQFPGGAIFQNTTATLTIPGLAPNTYTYTLAVTGCSSGTSANAVVNNAPTAAVAPSVGTITQPQCSSPGSVVLNGLPSSGTWVLTQNPGGTTISGSGTSYTVTNLSAGTYTYTVTNASGCTSPPSSNVVINTGSNPNAPIIGTITQPTCTNQGSVGLSGLPSTGAWTITYPGGTVPGTGSSTTLSLPGGTYTFTVTNSSGCVSAPSAEVTLNSQSALPAAPSIGTITPSQCSTPTGSVVLQGLPEGAWTLTRTPVNVTTDWSGYIFTVSGLAAGTYYFTVTNEGGCVSASSAPVTITTTNPPPAPTITAGGPTTFCIGGNVTLTSSAGTTYLWSTGATTQSITVTPASSGTFNFTVQITDALGCQSAPSSQMTVTVNPLPAVAAIGGGSPTVCEGGLTAAFTDGTAGGSWSITPGTGNASITAGGIVTGITAGTVTVVYTVTSSGCSNSATKSLTVNPSPGIPVVGTIIQPTCTQSTGSVSFSGLPSTGNWTITRTFHGTGTNGFISSSGSTYTWSGIPAGIYTFNVTAGICTSASTGQYTINAQPPTMTVGAASSTPTLCINTALTNITHTTTGATGISNDGVSGVNGLPAGVSAHWASNIITISGTPTASGTFNYSIPLTGGCGTVNATGTITVTPANTITLTSAPGTDNQAACINVAITNITYSTTGASGATVTGLPAGVTGIWSANVVTISGIPTALGTFGYTITLTGGCGGGGTSGTIMVNPVNTLNLTSLPGTDAQTVCIGTPITNITYGTTGATGIGTATGLPSGVTAGWATSTITISGTPTVSGTFNYTIPLTGGCGTVNATGMITVTANMTAGAASSTPTLCINTALTPITHTTTLATGISNDGVSGANGLPAGVSAHWASNTITISGTPTVSGTFNYTITLTGGCGTVNATGTITVTANMTAGAASSSPTLCINTALTNITHTTTGATGISNDGVSGANGLPAGVSAHWASNTITISGTPTVSGTFNYTITLTGGCGAASATGTITVNPNMTAGAASSTPTLCINTALTTVTHTTTLATGITNDGVSGANGLPAGVSAHWASNTITISGTPTLSGTFNYTITLTGGCGTVNATGTITVTANMTVGAASSTPTLCINTALTNITHTTTGATGISNDGVSGANGLPAGVSAHWASNTITISGTPTVSGTFNYTITLTGGCGTVNATGTITVTANMTAGAASSSPTLCINTALTNITHTTTGATGISNDGVSGANGLPAGVSAHWASNTITISGTPTVSGTFNYTITLTGGCGAASATGTITVNPNMTAGAASSSPTLCINTALTPITHTTTLATSISNDGVSGANGLPAGVSAHWASNTITISGTPTLSGTFNYTIPLTGGCGAANATGTITVTANMTAGAA